MEIWPNGVCDTSAFSLLPTVTPQANFLWKITFDILYTNGFSIRIRSRSLSVYDKYIGQVIINLEFMLRP